MKNSINFSERTILNFYIFTNLIISLILFSIVIYFCRFGFDLSDEGSYYNSYLNWKDYESIYSLFGHFYSVIYKLLGNKIYHLRIFNFLSTISISIYTTRIFIGNSLENKLKKSIGKYSPILISISLGLILSILGMNIIILTPGYSNINFIGCLICSSSILSIFSNKKDFNLIVSNPINKSILLAIGLSLTSYGRLSTYFLLIFLLIFYTFLFDKKIKKEIILGIAISALFSIIFLILIGENPFTLIEKIKNAKNWLSIKSSDYSALGLLISIFKLFFNTPPTSIFLISIATIVSIDKYKLNKNYKKVFLLIFLGFFTSIIFFLFFNNIEELIPFGSKILIVLKPWFLYIFFATIISNIKTITHFKNNFKLTNNNLEYKTSIIIISLLLIPFIYSFGTDVGAWFLAINSSLFFFLATLVLINYILEINKDLNLLGFILSLSIGILFILPSITKTYINPYRQTLNPLWQNSTKVYLRDKNNEIIVSSQFAEYLNNARSLLEKNNFKKDTPIIDMTGRSPGLIYALGGKAIALPWVNGGYEGSTEHFDAALKKTRCNEIYSSWIITQPNSTQEINKRILLERGINLVDNNSYQKIGNIKIPKMSSKESKSRIQKIYKPIIKSNQICR